MKSDENVGHSCHAFLGIRTRRAIRLFEWTTEDKPGTPRNYAFLSFASRRLDWVNGAANGTPAISSDGSAREPPHSRESFSLHISGPDVRTGAKEFGEDIPKADGLTTRHDCELFASVQAYYSLVGWDLEREHWYLYIARRIKILSANECY